MGLSLAERLRIRRASLIHGLGRAAIPNEVWNQSVPRGEADVERLRLVPYWTLRAGRRISYLAAEAEIASYADERLDGSGAFRGAKGVAIGIEARVSGETRPRRSGARRQFRQLSTARPLN